MEMTYETFYVKKRIEDIDVKGIIQGREILGYKVYVVDDLSKWYFCSLCFCFPFCFRKKKFVYQEPIYTNDFAPF